MSREDDIWLLVACLGLVLLGAGLAWAIFHALGVQP